MKAKARGIGKLDGISFKHNGFDLKYRRIYPNPFDRELAEIDPPCLEIEFDDVLEIVSLLDDLHKFMRLCDPWGYRVGEHK